MAVTVVRFNEFYACLSSDTKPANPTLILLYETDTGDWFIYNGSAWVAFFVPTAAA